MQERRLNVRVVPTGDYGIGIEYGEGLVKLRLSVLDAAVGGVALQLSEQVIELGVGTELRVGVTLPNFERFETVGVIRYTQAKVGGRCGVHFNKLTDEQQGALSRTVSELLERGHSA